MALDAKKREMQR
jgi:hypothetical protein